MVNLAVSLPIDKILKINLIPETLRKHPSAPFTFREALNDYQIPNSKHVIKKGTQIVIPNVCFHYDERYWANPQEFNPDRFTTEEIAKRPNFSYLPFGEGLKKF